MKESAVAAAAGATIISAVLVYLLRPRKTPPLRRVSLRLNGEESGIVIRLPATFGELLGEADRRLVSEKRGGDARAKRVFTAASDEVLKTDYDLIVENEVLYISCGEDWAAARTSAAPQQDSPPVALDSKVSSPVAVGNTVDSATSSFFWATSAESRFSWPTIEEAEEAEEPSFGVSDEPDAEAAFAAIAKQFSAASDAGSLTAGESPAARGGFGVSDVRASTVTRTAPVTAVRIWNSAASKSTPVSSAPTQSLVRGPYTPLSYPGA